MRAVARRRAVSSADNESARRTNTPPGFSSTPPSPDMAIVINWSCSSCAYECGFAFRMTIRSDSLRPPVPVRGEQLPDAGHTGDGANRCQHDRPIAGDALSPQRLLPERHGGTFAGRRAKRLVRVDERARQLLVEREVGRLDVEVAHFHLGLGSAARGSRRARKRQRRDSDRRCAARLHAWAQRPW